MVLDTCSNQAEKEGRPERPKGDVENHFNCEEADLTGYEVLTARDVPSN